MESDIIRLETIHHRAVRHMTGEHIKKVEDGSWVYPDHEKLLRKCRLLKIMTYVESRRNTLRGYLKNCNPTLWEGVQKINPPSRNPNKVLWWKQKVLSRQEMRKVKRDWLDLK